jgi:hypothetical protein
MTINAAAMLSLKNTHRHDLVTFPRVKAVFSHQPTEPTIVRRKTLV